MKKEWPVWEVFIRSKAGLDHRHAGSIHATDARMAIENARDVYTRRQEGVSIWVVPSKKLWLRIRTKAENCLSRLWTKSTATRRSMICRMS